MAFDESKYSDSDITRRVIGCAMTVHRLLGNGFQEVIYQKALGIELSRESIAWKREFEMPIFYRGEHIGTRRVDFLIEGRISVELKALTALEKVHLAQAKNYLEAYNLETGLLINFGGESLEFNRLWNKRYSASQAAPSHNPTTPQSFSITPIIPPIISQSPPNHLPIP